MKRWKVVDGFRNSYPGEITSVHYAEGATLESKTLGFFTFKTLKAAKAYKNSAPKDFNGQLSIIEVKCYGRGETINVCPSSINDIAHFLVNKDAIKKEAEQINNYSIRAGNYIALSTIDVWKCAEGTITYKKLKVLT